MDKKRFDENYDRIDWLQARPTLKAWNTRPVQSRPITEEVLQKAKRVILERHAYAGFDPYFPPEGKDGPTI